MLITLIIGLPGSGKTELGKTIPCEIFIDDPTFFYGDLPDKCTHMVITDPHFCNKHILNSAKTQLKITYGDVQFNEIYFENDPIQCKKNALLRPNKPVEHFIDYLSGIYDPPRVDMKVWNE